MGTGLFDESRREQACDTDGKREDRLQRAVPTPVGDQGKRGESRCEQSEAPFRLVAQQRGEARGRKEAGQHGNAGAVDCARCACDDAKAIDEGRAVGYRCSEWGISASRWRANSGEGVARSRLLHGRGRFRDPTLRCLNCKSFATGAATAYVYAVSCKGMHFGLLFVTALLGASLAACGKTAKTDTHVLVLGFDGMDPKFVRRHADRLPNLMRLAEQGGFTELETVMPPQSPVAWSTVITGMTPGGHGVFDFVHRHPHDVTPFSSMAKATPPEYTLEVGEMIIPLSGGETVPLRKGEAFWQRLSDAGIPSTMMKMPTDFPPLPATNGAVSGMGTPDMLGSFGTFQFFTDDPAEYVKQEVSGGEIYRVDVIGGHVSTTLYGPVNTFFAGELRTESPIEVDVDRARRTARVEVAGEVLVLQEGDWSEWVEVDFELVPYMMSASGIVRFFLKEAYPGFKLYASPININPKQQDVPISDPPEFGAEIAEEVGLFYTQGMAEETKALSAHLISREEFIKQAQIVFTEEIDIYRHLLGEYQRKGGGFMF